MIAVVEEVEEVSVAAEEADGEVFNHMVLQTAFSVSARNISNHI